MTIRSIANFDFSGGFQDLMGHVARVQSIGDFVFFKLILDYLRDRIGKFGFDLMDNMMAWVGGIALTLMTLWVLIQGMAPSAMMIASGADQITTSSRVEWCQSGSYFAALFERR